jgi:hypothetical protein
MRRAAMVAAIPILLSCARVAGTPAVEREVPDGIDPSMDRYMAETFLDCPSSGPTMEAGCCLDLDSLEEIRTRDAWIQIRSRGIRGAGRLRLSGETFREAYHIAVAPAGRIRIDLGDYVPDIGIGLVSSSRRFTYPFSRGHPFYRSRDIRGWTGFYGSFIRGASLRAAAGPFGVTLLFGRPAVHGSAGVEFPYGRSISGFRLDGRAGGIAGGITAIDGGSRLGERIAGLDLSYSSSGRRCMIEAAASREGRVSAVWGLGIDGKDAGLGVLVWSVPARSDGLLASFPGLSVAADRSRSGASMTLRKRFTRRTYMAAWGEVRRSSDGMKRETDSAFRLEAVIRWKRGTARCAWSSRVSGSEALVPFPPGRGVNMDLSRGLVISFACRPASPLRLVLEMKQSDSGEDAGLMVASRASLALRALHSHLSLSAASYRSSRGKARFSLYEPSGRGKYPWKTLYGSGARLNFGIDMGIGVVRASLYLLWAVPEELSEARVFLSAAI